MKKILIVKLGALGDVARATVMLPAIRQRYPEARITWLAGKAASELLALLRDPPEIVRIDDDAIFGNVLPQRLAAILAANFHIAGRAYDLTLIPYRSPLYRLLCLGARCGEIRGFRNRRGLIPGRSQCAEYARLVWQTDGPSLPAPVFPELDTAKLIAPARVPDILLAPGGARNFLADNGMRRWPLENYRQLARLLLERGLTVGIVGGKEDMAEAAAFAGLEVSDFVGKTNLAELFGLLRKAGVLVSHDTGSIHCMNLLGGKLVALFGPTRASEMLGTGHNICALTGGASLSCRPCYDGRCYAACSDAACLQQITPSDVLDVLLHRIRR